MRFGMAAYAIERDLKLQEFSVSNRGLRPKLVGTPAQVRERIEQYEEVGLDLLLLQMSPQAEFADTIITSMKH
jgi:FMNH2-dependent dimethyl sulfone monooxygenase